MNAVEHLSNNDPVLAGVIERSEQFSLRPHTDYYNALVSSIISQQLSTKAAATIKKRFLELFGGIFPTPEQILEKQVEELRAVGLSNSKATYIQDLAHHIIDGRLELDKLPRLNNETIIKELVAVKGIGEWTAHMFLIFALGRLDVLPIGDLGIRIGVQKLYGLKDLPLPSEITKIAENNSWHPYESVAAWHIWRSLDNSP